jgi:hypothetical protein
MWIEQPRWNSDFPWILLCRRRRPSLMLFSSLRSSLVQILSGARDSSDIRCRVLSSGWDSALKSDKLIDFRNASSSLATRISSRRLSFVREDLLSVRTSESPSESSSWYSDSSDPSSTSPVTSSSSSSSTPDWFSSYSSSMSPSSPLSDAVDNAVA